MSEEEKDNEQTYLLKNIELCNGFTLKKFDFSKNINLYYASNGTSKSTIYNYLINDFKFENYEIFSHSYLSAIKNIKKTNLEKVIENINLINSDSNIEIKKSSLEKIEKIKNSFPTLLNNEHLLLGYSEYKENFFNKFSKISSFEQFFKDFFKIQDFFKKDMNTLTNFLSSFCSIFNNVDFSKIENDKFYDLLQDIESSKKNFLTWEEENKNFLSLLDKKIEALSFIENNEKFQESDHKHFLKQREEIKKDFEQKQLQENDRLKKEIRSFFNINNNLQLFQSYSYRYNNRNAFLNDWVNSICNWIMNNQIIQKTISSVIQYEIFDWITNNIFTLNILFALYKTNKNIVIELNKFNEISKDLKLILEEIKEKSDFSQRKEIERKFNSFFFDYIKFSNIKIIDYLFFDKKIKINIFVNGKIISDFNNISDGELNALLLISMYIKMSLSSFLKKIIIMDDSSIAFDKTNWLGLLNLLSDFVNESNKVVIFSHDYSFINIAQKFLSRKTIDNHKISIGTYQLIRENSFISLYDYEYCNDNKFNSFENFLVKNFLNLSISGERNKEIENLLHYSSTSKASDLVSSLDNSFLEKEKKELLEFIEKHDVDNIIDFFEKLINCKNCSKLSKKLYKIFLVRMKIEKICVENTDSQSADLSNNQKSVGTLNIIKNSNLNKEKQDELINIYNNLPTYIHLNFYDISYIFDLNIDFIDSLFKRIESFENKLKKENTANN